MEYRCRGVSRSIDELLKDLDMLVKEIEERIRDKKVLKYLREKKEEICSSICRETES